MTTKINAAQLDARTTLEASRHRWIVSFDTVGGNGVSLVCIDPCDDPVLDDATTRVCACAWLPEHASEVGVTPTDLPVTVAMEGSEDESNNPISGHEPMEAGWLALDPVHVVAQRDFDAAMQLQGITKDALISALNVIRDVAGEIGGDEPATAKAMLQTAQRITDLVETGLDQIEGLVRS